MCKMLQQQVVTRESEVNDSDDGPFDPASVTLEREISRGGFGRVYAAKVKNQRCAIKVFSHCSAIEMENEVKILKRVSLQHPHPGIARFMFYSSYQGKMVIGTELCEGGDLYTAMTRAKLTPIQTKLYSSQVALALEHLHLHNVLYLDLKPENIVLTNGNRIKLVDFGLSRILSDQEESCVVSRGSLQYSAPEVFMRKNCTFATDWWSFGVLLFELEFYELPFDFRNDQETAQDLSERICTGELPIITVNENDQPELFHERICYDLVERLLQKDPAQRIEWNEIKQHPYFSPMP